MKGTSDRGSRSRADDSSERVTCKGCGGIAQRGQTSLPAGWYGLSAGVPVELDRMGRGYIWAGLFCSAYCLAMSMGDIASQEELARLAYEPVPAIGGTR